MKMGETVAELSWKLAVFDESGKERWRVTVADTLEDGVPLNHSFVEIGEHRVVIARPDGSLHAWDATDGKQILPG